MKTLKLLSLVLSTSLLLFILSSCSSSSIVDENKAKEVQAPVTLKVFAGVNYMSDNEFTTWNSMIAKKYPYITLQMIRPSKDVNLNALISAGDVPDLYIDWNGAINDMIDKGMSIDLEPLVKKDNLDLSKFEPVTLDAIRNDSKDGRLHAMPYAQNFQLLYYNKDIFDKFAQPYPKAGMTWEEVTDLAKKLTRTDGETQYIGLNPLYQTMQFQLSLPFVDPNTKKSIVTGEEWKKVFTTSYNIWSLSGLSMKDVWAPHDGEDLFIKNQTLAMLATKNRNNLFSNSSLNWDVTQFPSFKDKPGVSNQVDVHVVFITEACKHKEQAFKAMELLSSEEYQTSLAKIGKLPVLSNKKILKEFAADVPYLKGKHWNEVFKSKFSVPPNRILPDGMFSSITDKAFQDYTTGSDVNTVLSKADEEINKVVQENLH